MNSPGTNVLRAILLATSSLVAAGAPCPVYAAGPTGAEVVVGQATITHPKLNETLVNQSSNKALIDWSSFSVPRGWLVDFNQPGKSSLTVNRVTGASVSQIDGDLLANGAIWIINANGIVFGRGSEVNVGALLATTSDINNSDFDDGHYAFSKHSANPNASVVNRGTIRAASGGSVVMSAPHVVNQGAIQADLGKVVLGGANAFTVDMAGDNLIRYQITAPVTSTPKAADGKADPALVSNSGTISAAGGKVVMTASAAKSVQDDVINNTGIVEATSVSAHDGEIDLDAGPNGTVNAGGTLDVSGNSAGQKGGTIEVAGNNVHVENGATLNASGDAGGGTVLIGGGFHGRGPIANAETTLVGKATIDASATGRGNGGRVAVWSNKHTVFAGKIDVQGGHNGGNGGYVETSSAVSLQVAFDAIVNASASYGTKGSWLLDPLNIIIETGGTTQLDNGVLGLNQDPGKTDTIDPGTITTALNSTNVLLEAANDITVVNDVLYSSTNSLLLLAEHDINAYANIQNSMASGGGGVYLIAGWNGTTTNISQLTNNGVYGNNGGSIFVGTTNAPGNVAVGSASGETVAAGDNVTVEADNADAIIGYEGLGTGNIDVLATGNVTVDALAYPYAQIGNNGYNVSGNIAGNITITAGGDITLEDNYTSGFAVIGNDGGDSQSGNITLNASGSVVIDSVAQNSGARVGNTGNGATTTSGDISVTAGSLSIESSGQNAGATIGNYNDDVSGNIDITAGNIQVAATGTSDSASIGGSAAGNETGIIQVNSSGDITLDALGQNAYANIGFDVTGSVDSQISVSTNGGSLTLDAGANETVRLGSSSTNGAVTDPITVTTSGGAVTLETSGAGNPEIGNFSSATTQSLGGDITIDTSGGDLNLDAGVGFACICNSSSGTGSVGGNIEIDTSGGSLDLSASGSDAVAFIGNTEYDGGASISGDISITAGAVSLNAIGDGSTAFIGNGGFGFTGSTAGDIDISATSLTLSADDPDAQSASARIMNRGGSVSGNISLDISGNILISAADLDVAAIGNESSVDTSGNIDVSAGGSITIEATGEGEARIAAGTAPDTNIDVTAVGDIIISDDNDSSVGGGGAGAWIGNFSSGGSPTGGNIDVTSSHGSIVVEASDADGDGATAYIGNTSGSTTTSGSITLAAPQGDITLDSSDATAFVLVGNNDQGYSGATSGDISVTAGGALDIEGTNSIIGNEGTAGDVSGSVTLSADSFPDTGFLPSFLNDIPNGNFTVIESGAGNAVDNTPIYYSSAYAFSYTTAGSLVVEAPFQNSGTGAINVTATGNILIGGTGAPGSVSVGSYGGATTVTADNLTIESDNGIAQLGYAGAGGGDINVTTTEDVTVDALNGNWAQIGNGGEFQGGSITGNITIGAGHDINVESVFLDQNDFTYATIGNAGGYNSSESGDIKLTAPGNIQILSEPDGYGCCLNFASVGNFSTYNGGNAIGNITISAGTLTVDAAPTEGNFYATAVASIGDGDAFITEYTGNIGGTIDIKANDVNVETAGDFDSYGYAYIGNEGYGNIIGDIDINATGSVTISGPGFGQASIGNDPFQEGITNGSINIQAGNTISLLSSQETESSVFIGNGNAADSDINLTAGGNILIEGLDGYAYVGNFSYNSPSGGNITLKSTGGSIELEGSDYDAKESPGEGEGAFIGNVSYGGAASGNITVTASNAANGDIILESLDGLGLVAIGNNWNINEAATSVSGSVSLGAGNALEIKNGPEVLVGNTVVPDATSGSVFISGKTLDGNLAPSFLNDIPNGDFTLDLSGTTAFGIDVPLDYSSSFDATLSVGGNLALRASLQNSGTGAIDITSGGTITIGGLDATGDVAIGSAGGSTTIIAANLVLAADNGYAQLGFDGAGSGGIDVTTSGGVRLDGGSGAYDFAQIGNGGYQTSGSESGDITIVAGGNITLSGGSGGVAYAQIGNGGAESNENSKGYGDTSTITLNGDNIVLVAGAGNVAYVQVGNGGYEVGKGLTGKGTETGAITLDAVNSVTLDGDGINAYAQIGNGGDMVDLDAAAGASGGATGDVTIAVANSGGSVTLAAGAGSDAYAQIGDGGYAEDTPNGNAVNFVTGDNVEVTASAVTLTGGDSGDNAYAQIGNGDAAKGGDADVDGNITVSALATTTDGTASGSDAVIGNETGTGTVSGTVIGGGTTETETVDTVVALTQSATSSADDVVVADYSLLADEQPQFEAEETVLLAPPPPSPLEQMADASSNGDPSFEGKEPSDDLVASLGQSLSPGRGHKKSAYVTVRTLIPGVLKEIVSSGTRKPHGVPPADEIYSSWGNEALWK